MKQTPTLNFIDRVVGFFNPLAAIRRAGARELMTRRHEAAGRGRRHPGEMDSRDTANQAIGTELAVLRTRSQNQIDNNGFAGQSQNVLANGIVGTGIRPSVRIENKELEKRILKYWTDWSTHHSCDFKGRETFAGLQQMVIRATYATGEAVIRRRRNQDGSISLQVHEGDYIDSTITGTVREDGSTTMHGIEYDADGRTIAYWLYDSLETNTPRYNLESRRIPVADVCHVFYADRAGRDRGLPWMRNVYVGLMDAARFMDADLQRAIVAACHAAFVSGNTQGITGFEVTDYASQLDRLEPGAINYLQPGEEVSFNTPPSNSGLEPFMRTILRSIAAGQGITYEAMANDYSQVNFSSAKMGSNEMERNFSEKRERVMIYPLNRVWEWFMESLVIQGLLEIPMAEARKIRADWTAPRRAMIDMVKETEGLRLQIAAGLISWQEAVRMCGGDPDDVQSELAAALGIMDTIGFVPTWNVPTQEMNQLAIENEAKQTTADAAKTNAENGAE